MSDRVTEKIVRRELHASRSVAVSVVAVLLAAALAWAAVETALEMLGRAALWVRPSDALRAITELPQNANTGIALACGAAAAVVGVVLIALAVAPGRRARHRLASTGVATIADNGVLASGVAAQVSRDLGLPRDAVRVGVGHRSVDITAAPEFGLELDAAEVRAAAQRATDDLATTRTLTPRVRIARGRDQEELS